MEPLSILLFLILFALSAFFSGSEIAFMSLAKHQVDSFIKQRRHGAKSLKHLKKNPDRLLILILVGNNLVNVSTAALATKISIDFANSYGFEQSIIIGISTGLITLLLLLFGEIFPKTISSRHADKIALSVAGIYIFLGKLFYTIIIAIEYLMKFFQKNKKNEETITDEEIESLIDIGNKAGIFEKGEYEKIKNMLDFYEITAQEVMTPRIKIESLSDNLSVKKAKEIFLKYSHSRVPIYQKTIDNIDHFITLRDLINAEKNGFESKKLKELSLSEMLKVPITKPIHLILEQFKRTRSHIATVIDEYGGVAGLITLEDVVEEVFGEIMDEIDNETVSIKKDGGSYIFKSHITMDEFLEKMSISFYEIGISEDEFGGETLSYFITSHLERFPKTGEEIFLNINRDDFRNNNLYIKVLSLEKNAINEIKAEIVKSKKTK